MSDARRGRRFAAEKERKRGSVKCHQTEPTGSAWKYTGRWQRCCADISDPRVSTMCSVVRTELSKGRMYCKAYISVYGTQQEQEETFSALIKATPFIRHQLGSRLRIRKMPELKLVPDDSITYSVRIGQLIDQINTQRDSDPKEGEKG